MKDLYKGILLLVIVAISLTSCREAEKEADKEKSEVEKMMQDPNNKVEVKDGGNKIKIETPEGDEIKIKKEGDEYKKKIDAADGKDYKLKVDGNEVKEKTDH